MKTSIRKAIIITCLTGSALIFLQVVKAGDALLRFIAAGHIPGTNIYLDASAMLVLWMLLIGIIVGRISGLVFRRHNTLRPQL